MDIKEVLKEWNIKDIPVQIHQSAWNMNDFYILKVYDNIHNMHRNITIMRMLHDAGIPVPTIMNLPDGRDYCKYNNRFYVLTTKLKGKTLENLSKCDNGWFFQFGTILGKLHIALKHGEKRIQCRKKHLLEEMNGWVSRDLFKFKPEYLNHKDIQITMNELSLVYDELPKQLIHRDVHMGNFLFDNGKFSGYIDFDLSQRNIRIFDICYFLLGILTEKEKNGITEEKWYEMIHFFIEGYESITELSSLEKNAISCVMKNIELLCTAYFLGIGEEKSAKDSADTFLFIQKNKEKIQNSVGF